MQRSIVQRQNHKGLQKRHILMLTESHFYANSCVIKTQQPVCVYFANINQSSCYTSRSTDKFQFWSSALCCSIKTTGFVTKSVTFWCHLNHIFMQTAALSKPSNLHIYIYVYFANIHESSCYNSRPPDNSDAVHCSARTTALSNARRCHIFKQGLQKCHKCNKSH